MNTVTTKLSDELNARLEKLAKLTDRNKSYLLKKAIEFYLNEKENYLIELHQAEQENKLITIRADAT